MDAEEELLPGWDERGSDMFEMHRLVQLLDGEMAQAA
jgi:hypothetical protein